mmetsp:Transcript_5375/g.16038  ORF Transcript_5375/g.16038 Transcript_5375/m.16038 type:complete len:205 (+) Transcript_5375:399-1013(+)
MAVFTGFAPSTFLKTPTKSLPLDCAWAGLASAGFLTGVLAGLEDVCDDVELGPEPSVRAFGAFVGVSVDDGEAFADVVDGCGCCGCCSLLSAPAAFPAVPFGSDFLEMSPWGPPRILGATDETLLPGGTLVFFGVAPLWPANMLFLMPSSTLMASFVHGYLMSEAFMPSEKDDFTPPFRELRMSSASVLVSFVGSLSTFLISFS